MLFYFGDFYPKQPLARIEVSKLASSGAGVVLSVRLLSCADYALNYIQDGSVASRLQEVRDKGPTDRKGWKKTEHALVPQRGGPRTRGMFCLKRADNLRIHASACDCADARWRARAIIV